MHPGFVFSPCKNIIEGLDFSRPALRLTLEDFLMAFDPLEALLAVSVGQLLSQVTSSPRADLIGLIWHHCAIKEMKNTSDALHLNRSQFFCDHYDPADRPEGKTHNWWQCGRFFLPWERQCAEKCQVKHSLASPFVPAKSAWFRTIILPSWEVDLPFCASRVSLQPTAFFLWVFFIHYFSGREICAMIHFGF